MGKKPDEVVILFSFFWDLSSHNSGGADHADLLGGFPLFCWRIVVLFKIM